MPPSESALDKIPALVKLTTGLALYGDCYISNGMVHQPGFGTLVPAIVEWVDSTTEGRHKLIKTYKVLQQSVVVPLFNLYERHEKAKKTSEAGSKTSERKSQAAKLNGLKGGRPPKSVRS